MFQFPLFQNLTELSEEKIGKWKFISEVGFNVDVALPQDYDEIMCCMRETSTGAGSSLSFPRLYAIASPKSHYFQSGGFSSASPTTGSNFVVHVTETAVTLVVAWVNGANVQTTSHMAVYYR